MTSTIIDVSDLHINSTVALCAPDVELEDGKSNKLSNTQRWLWDCWLDLADKTSAYKNDKLIGLYNGDIGEGDYKDRSYQITTKNEATIVRMIIDTLDPITKLTETDIFIRGTGAHVGKSGVLEELIANDLGTKSYYERHLDVEGVRIHASHHTSMGGTPHTERNAANQLAARVMYNYANDGERPPDIVLRGHVHRWSDSGDNFIVRALVTPCFTFATEHTTRISPDKLPEIGAAFIHCDNKKYEIEKVKYKPKGRSWVKI